MTVRDGQQKMWGAIEKMSKDLQELIQKDASTNCDNRNVLHLSACTNEPLGEHLYARWMVVNKSVLKRDTDLGNLPLMGYSEIRDTCSCSSGLFLLPLSCVTPFTGDCRAPLVLCGLISGSIVLTPLLIQWDRHEDGY